ncbi:hypothetical protein LCGC14_2074010, partial [marine sediment metagenome]
MNRIDARFKELKERNETAFIPFITAGDPSLEVTKALIMEFNKRGADLIELGVPFSDPIADGPVIQSSYYRALSGGVKLSNVLELVKSVREKSEIPIVSMISYSILYKNGCENFIRNAVKAGFDGAYSFEGQNDPFISLTAAAMTTEKMQLMTSIAVAFA